MFETVTIGLASEIPAGGGKLFESAGRRIMVFHLDGEFHALDGVCPHRGGSLSADSFTGKTVSCPLHGWEFDIMTGECTTQAGNGVERFTVHVEGGELRLEIPAVAEADAAKADGVHRYLIRYGALGWVAWFGTIDDIPCHRKDQVVVQTSRGLEFGEVLSSPLDGQRADTIHSEKPTGELLRVASDSDRRQAQELAAPPAELMDACQQLLVQHHLAVDVVDYERLLDGQTAVLYFLGEQFPELETIGQQLSEVYDFDVRFFPLIEPPPQAGGCGTGGCGSGGCGSGGCGSDDHARS